MWEKALETDDAQCKGVVRNLNEGHEYQFRITAVNKAGPGEPSDPSKNIIAKPRYCKFFFFKIRIFFYC